VLAAAAALALALGGLMAFDKIREPGLEAAWNSGRTVLAAAEELQSSVDSTASESASRAQGVAGAQHILRDLQERDARDAAVQMRRLRDAERLEPALKPQIDRNVALAVAVVDASQHTPSASAEPLRAFDAEIAPFLESLRATVKDRCAAYEAVHIAWQRAPYNKIDCSAEL
jgi:hypothetical protein